MKGGKLLRALVTRVFGPAVAVHGDPLRACLAAFLAARVPTNRSGNNASVR